MIPPPLPINIKPAAACSPASMPVAAVVVVVGAASVVVVVSVVAKAVVAVDSMTVVVADSEVLLPSLVLALVLSALVLALVLSALVVVDEAPSLVLVAGLSKELSIDWRIETSDDSELDEASVLSVVARGILMPCAPTAWAVRRAPPARSAEAIET